MSIPSKFLINDVRTELTLRNKSFSGFSTKEVISTLKKKLMNNEIEESINWAIELFLSLHIKKLYDIFLDIYIKNINSSNPSLPLKLYKRYTFYNNNNKLAEHELRNVQVIRNHIAELCCIICLSNKNKNQTTITIKDEEMSTENIIKKFKATQNYIDFFYKSNDPEELKLIINEFIYNLKTKNYVNTIYFLFWLVKYDKLTIKKKKRISCHSRFISEDSKNQNDFIWLLWDIVLKEGNTIMSKETYIQIVALYKMYRCFYKPANKYKHIGLLVCSIKYFTDMYDINVPVIYNNYICIQLSLKINFFILKKKNYEQLKHSQNNIIINVKKKKDVKKKDKTNTKFDIINTLDIRSQ